MHEPRVELSDVERAHLIQGLLHWGGPAHPSDSFAQRIGYPSADRLRVRARELRQVLREKDFLPVDVVTEMIALATFNIHDEDNGTGHIEWPIVAGFDVDESTQVLRELWERTR